MNAWNLQLSPTKLSVTLFITWTKVIKLVVDIFVNGVKFVSELQEHYGDLIWRFIWSRLSFFFCIFSKKIIKQKKQKIVISKTWISYDLMTCRILWCYFHIAYDDFCTNSWLNMQMDLYKLFLFTKYGNFLKNILKNYIKTKNLTFFDIFKQSYDGSIQYKLSS